MKSKFIALLLVIFALTANNPVQAAPGDSQISAMAGPWPIEIKTCAKFAGAICSVKWRQKEFIDTADHGRLLQSAVQFDNLLEAFNPTEAGSRWDGGGSSSSSQLQGIWTNGNVLSTQTRMAFWLRPGEYSPDGGWAVNTTVVSNHIHNKLVTIGVPGVSPIGWIPHAIQYRTQFTIPENESHFRGQFEVVTGYMPPEFSKFYTYDIASQTLSDLSDGPGAQNLPIIFSTPDGGWAMGIYAPAHSAATPSAPSYGRWRFNGVVKWNAGYGISNPSGTYHFESYVAVGSLDNVMVTMDQLWSSGY